MEEEDTVVYLNVSNSLPKVPLTKLSHCQSKNKILLIYS